MKKIFSIIALFLISIPAYGDDKITVISSILPIHHITQAVTKNMDNIETILLIDPRISPHDYQLKPSDIAKLERSNKIFAIGDHIELSLHQFLKNNDKYVSLLNNRKLDVIHFEGHHDDHDGHDDHGHKKHDDHGHDKHHDDHDDHGHKKHDDHGHKKHDDRHEKHHDDHDDHEHKKHDDHGHKKHDDHHDKHHSEDGELDQHIWMNADNAIIMARHIGDEIKHELEKHNIAFDNKQLRNNIRDFTQQADEAHDEISEMLKPLKDKKFIVYHHAYRYITQPYHLDVVAEINTAHHSDMISAKHINTIIAIAKHHKISCIFSEPQFDAKVLKVISEEVPNIKNLVLDPMGVGTKNYPEFLTNLATSISQCY